jgi:uncharacterized damage-inducible protein DinB
MATVNDVLLDALGRVHESVRIVLDELDDRELAQPPVELANTVGWLVWHLTRVVDDHMADAFDRDQVWAADGWARRFGLPFDDRATGYGQTHDQVRQVRVSGELLRGYHDAVQAFASALLQSVDQVDLDRVVDRRWDPPVTLAVRLVSLINDATQHVGQAAYAAGILLRARSSRASPEASPTSAGRT